MISTTRLRQGIVIVFAAAALLATLVQLPSPLRAILVYPWIFLGPGLAITGLVRIRDPLMELTLVLVVSLALQTLLATLVLYLGIYSSELVLVVTVFVAIGALVADSSPRIRKVGQPAPSRR